MKRFTVLLSLTSLLFSVSPRLNAQQEMNTKTPEAIHPQAKEPNLNIHQESQLSKCQLSPSWLKPYTASYTIYRDGDKSGKGTRSLTRTGENWELISSTRAEVFFFKDRRTEKSVFNWDRGFEPISYRYETKNSFKKQLITEFFDGDLKIVRGTRSKKGKWQFPLTEGLSDPLSHQLLLREKLIAVKKEWTKNDNSTLAEYQFKPMIFSFEVSSKGKVRQRQYQLVAEEKITTKAGSFDSFKLIRKKGTKKTILWMATDLDFIPVKIYQEKDGDEQATMILDQYEFHINGASEK